ncbi:hypothetical protein K466DRAFT_279904 [Polyporus arcularius HHB13444]|uniref:Uncharacterized protein n=1 Tax=Polyporus arcularius HHB13444 TaxID=1314778 RepID=A0A5C3P0X7_9APHY|nr:hypothetical protein K466DRAFT_279904 [Polyporus arcularius HHB13444]
MKSQSTFLLPWLAGRWWTRQTQSRKTPWNIGRGCCVWVAPADALGGQLRPLGPSVTVNLPEAQRLDRATPTVSSVANPSGLVPALVAALTLSDNGSFATSKSPASTLLRSALATHATPPPRADTDAL